MANLNRIVERPNHSNIMAVGLLTYDGLFAKNEIQVSIVVHRDCHRIKTIPEKLLAMGFVSIRKLSVKQSDYFVHRHIKLIKGLLV